MRRNDIVFLILATIGGALLLSRKAAAAPSSAPSGGPSVAPPEIPGTLAPSASQVTAAQAIWQNFTPVSAPSSGYVNFPSGSQAAATFLPFATDGAGNTYTLWAGQIYLVVTIPDAQGNYPAKLLGT